MDAHGRTIRANEMQSRTGSIQRLYIEKLSAYRRFISFFRYRDTIRKVLESSGVFRPKVRALDAGAGFGTATFALLDALRHRGIEPEAMEAFDLTPAIRSGSRVSWIRAASGRFVSNKQTSWSSISNCPRPGVITT